MEFQETITNDLEKSDTSSDTKKVITLVEPNIENIVAGTDLVNGLPDIKEATLPDKKVSKEYFKLDLKYPTKHLKGFNDFSIATRLQGGEYTLIEKAVWYAIHSCLTPEVILKLNGVKTDGRIHMLIPLMSGCGKGELKRVLKYILEAFGKIVSEPTSLHPEQLVGKTVRRQNKGDVTYEQLRGYLSQDYLIVDEAKDLLTSNDPIYSESRRYLRMAQDTYPNDITKKTVDIPFENQLKYATYVGTCLFTQPYALDERFATDGDLRRYIMVYVNMAGIDRTSAYHSNVLDYIDSDTALLNFIKYLKSLTQHKTFQLSDDAIPYFDDLSTLLINRGFSYSEKIRNFTQINAYTIQNRLLEMCAVQAMQSGTNIIKKDHVSLAFVDLLEFYEHTYDFITNKIRGMMDYGEGWGDQLVKIDRLLNGFILKVRRLKKNQMLQ